MPLQRGGTFYTLRVDHLALTLTIRISIMARLASEPMLAVMQMTWIIDASAVPLARYIN